MTKVSTKQPATCESGKASGGDFLYLDRMVRRGSVEGNGLAAHPMPGLIGPWSCPRAPRDLRAIGQAVDRRDLKALAASIRVVIKHAEEAPALGVARPSQSHRMDRPVHATEGDPARQGDLLTRVDHHRRQLPIGWMLPDKKGLAPFVRGDERL